MPVGVTTKKNTKPITIGETYLPNNIPNLNHNMFSGVKIFEFFNPSKRNADDIINDHILMSLFLSKGYKPINKKTTKKTMPKLLFEPTLISLI